MGAKLSTALRNYLENTDDLATGLNLCKIRFFDGPIPADADVALTGSNHELCAMDSGGTGGTWGTAANGALPKNAGETWDALITTSGTPTFFRITISSDTGATLATTERRWQDTAGGTGNAVVFTNPVLVANGSNRKGVTTFELRMP